MRSVKALLICTALCCIIAVSMIIGINIAWNNSPLSSAPEQSANSLVTNNLEVSVEQINLDGTLTAIEKDTLLFGEDTVWTPGHAEIVYLVVTNKEETVVNYSIGVNFADSAAAKNAAGEEVKLSDVLHFGIVDSLDDFYGEPADAIADLGVSKALSSGFSRVGAIDAEGIEILAVLVYLPESAGELTGGEISLGLSLYVTSPLVEEEIAPVIPNYFTGSVNAPAVDTNGATTESVTIGEDSKISAVLPEGVKLENGATELSLSVNGVAESEANITANHRSEVVNAVDVHIDGIAEDNTVPMAIVLNGFLPKGLNSNNVKLYHVEDGVTNEMVLVDNPKNHNEFAYDPATGDVLITIASFSEIVLYGDTAVAWDGTVATGFNGGTGTEADPFIIATAEQLAYFRNEVDAGNTFEGKYVKLNANINLNNINFDPIGWGYDYDGFTEGGKTFNGIFDGNNKTIFGLYQNGWDLDPDKTNYSNYTYSMAGGGLFASVVDATIKNLTISGADIVFECIDMGVVAGYAQGKCTFDNISIINCTIQNYNRYTGGVVGEVSPRYNADGTPVEYTLENGDVVKGGYHVFNNIKVDSTTTVSSLWGSFDTSLGGILGGKWDKNDAKTKVTMTNCDVACTIDAFNDVTSAYQWYAYRRAGMLIGNTEQSADNKALANFLTCSNVYVYYGEWNNYHYCEFENQSDAEGNSSSWNRYPWVRVESGLSCSAYSNPRYGHPVVNGKAIVDGIHSHAGDDQCMISLPFAQLYGGGQGVYGATEHDGVKEGKYTVTYVNYGETIKVEFVGDNSNVHTLWNPEEYIYGETKAIAWVDGDGKEISSIEAGNIKNYIVYPKFQGEFTIRFFDAENNILYYEVFKEKENHTLDTEKANAALSALQDKIDYSREVITITWDQDISSINFKSATGDIVVRAKYSLANSKISLVPVYDENDPTKLVAYSFADYDYDSSAYENIVIPPRVGVTPIISIEDDVFAGYNNLVSVEIPSTITSIGANAFEDGASNSIFGGGRSTITIYFNGSAATWKKYMDNFYKGNSYYTKYNTVGTYDDDKTILTSGWDDGLGDGSRIFFLDADGMVDNSCYWELYVEGKNFLGGGGTYTWVYHDHAYTNGVAHSGCDKPVSSTQHTNYETDQLNGTDRPDQGYWVKKEAETN